MRAAGSIFAVALALVLAIANWKTRFCPPVQATAGESLIRNGGFEETGSPVPPGWYFEQMKPARGSVATVGNPVHEGKSALKLAPNGANTGGRLLGLGQAIPAAPLRGKKVRVSAWMGAENGAVAVLGLFAVRGNGETAGGVQLRATEPGLAQQEDTVQVDNGSENLILYLVVEGKQGAAFFDDVVVKLDTPVSRVAPSSGQVLSAAVSVDASVSIRTIPRTLFGANVAWIWDGNGAWNPKTGQLNPEIVGLARDLGLGQVRFPAGLFSDFYHWKDGVGPRGSRKETEHHPGGDRSVHHFGTEEVLAFGAETGAEMLFTANAGNGTAEEAAEWVRFANTRPAGPRVRDWEIGNELYINDGSRISKAITVTPQVYASRLRQFAEAMRRADPSIRIGAIGGENRPRYESVSYRDWNSELLRRAGDQIDFLAVHNAYAPLAGDAGTDVRELYAAMLAAPIQIAKNLAVLDSQIASLVPGRSRQIKLAVTEWGPLFSGDARNPFVDHVKTLGSALFVASAMNAFIQSPRTEIADFLTLADNGYAGWIGLRKGKYVPKAPYWALQMYTRHFGSVLVRSSAVSPVYDSRAFGVVDAARDVPFLDAVAARSTDGRTLFVLGVNKSFDNPIRARIRIAGFRPRRDATAWVLSGTGPDANTGTELPFPEVLHWSRQAEDRRNPRFSAGGPQEVRLEPAPFDAAGTDFEYTFAPYSLTSLELKADYSK